MALALRTLALLVLGHIVVVTLFLRGFLLTRVELPHVSSCAETGCAHQRYDRAVLVIIDALRHDFVCAPERDPRQYQGLLPRTLSLAHRAVGLLKMLRGGCP